MSPLARSLLTLAAFFAASNAKVTKVDLGVGGRCVKFIIDIPPRPVPYKTPQARPKFTMMSYDTSTPLKTIPNYCADFNEEIARETVEVCNDYVHPSLPLIPPLAFAVGDEVVSPVYAGCYKNTECGPLYFKIDQECRKPAI
ncbi:uncharacterized protein LOC133534281 [Cydia pomonella]|uniref:uncharacterized protein LOC133518364 n=1 Tax=Cydia pomonella TaxID=82600 RepID=UPI002ADD6F25|nr:uncharacterized protein LOC133518364 [Cydia pomonella]XP_061729364.1 uncharacterized protein LOC133534281 [Cydia pomonella]